MMCLIFKTNASAGTYHHAVAGSRTLMTMMPHRDLAKAKLSTVKALLVLQNLRPHIAPWDHIVL